MVFKFEDIMHGVMWYIVVTTDVFFKCVMMWVTIVVFGMLIVQSVMFVMVFIEVFMVSVVVVLTSCQSVKNVTNVAFDVMRIRLVLLSMIPSLFFKTFLNCLVLSFIFVWGRTKLLLVVLIVVVPFVKTVDASISMSFEHMPVVTMMKDISTVYFMVLMMYLIFSFMWIMSNVILVKVWIVPVVILLIV